MPPRFKIAVDLFTAAVVVLTCASHATAVSAGKKKSKYLGAPVFNIDKRKKTKTQINDWSSFSAYSSVRYSGERNLRLDDDISDKSDKYSAYLGVAARAEPLKDFVGFVHAEAEITKRITHKNKSSTKKVHLKEAVVAHKLTERSTFSVGRMRFSDARKWMADASVDGIHYGFKDKDLTLDLAAFESAYEDTGRYALAHISKFTKTNSYGGFVILESREGEKRAHLAAYWADKPSDSLSYTLNAGMVLGDAANDQRIGVAADARLIKTISDHDLKPQLTLGLAAGGKGFQQTGIHSNKTYDGGQTQFHRYGYVYQPQLTNMAVATVGLGIRPSRMFSLDVTAHAYAQIEKMDGMPAARVGGETNGKSAFLGAELSAVGAWRPTKKSKFEFGLSIFQPGDGYENRKAAKQAYARLSVYF